MRAKHFLYFNKQNFHLNLCLVEGMKLNFATLSTNSRNNLHQNRKPIESNLGNVKQLQKNIPRKESLEHIIEFMHFTNVLIENK